MAKKNNPKQHQQLLSPENYIRQKARKLPIHECKIHKTWQAEKMTQVIVSRKHANGNFSLAFYLVDLGCLGIKDSFFKFNVDNTEYDEIIDKFDENLLFINTSYAMAHNIVFAALDYADDLGFKPCKEFTQTTRFMLEEDTDDVELIEIECGVNGKPMYINTGFDSEIRVKQIINQLEKAVGKGNFEYIMGMDDDKYDDDDDDDDYDDDDTPNEFGTMNLDELKEEFLELIQENIENDNLPNPEKLLQITDEICLRICDDTVTDAYVRDWKDETEIEFEEEQINAKFLDLKAGTPISKSTENLIDKIFDTLADKDSKAPKLLQKLEKVIGKTAFTAFLELVNIRESESSYYLQKLNDYCSQYPDYALLKLLKHVSNEEEKEDVSTIVLPKLKDIFSRNDKITDYEFFQFISEKAMLIFRKSELNVTEAFYYFLDDLELSEGYYTSIIGMVTFTRIALLVKYFDTDLSHITNDTKLKIAQPKGQTDRAFQFRIQLKNISKPPVWRRIVMPDNASFDEFHNVIQIAFGWENYHLYNFSPTGWGSNPVIAIPSEYDEEPVLNATVTELKDVFAAAVDKYSYLYDFGDNWEHQIELEEIHTNYNRKLPVCLDGKGCCPPEDCGGVMGYEHLKEVFANPKNPEYREMLSWLGLKKGSDWDSNEFNIDDVNEELDFEI